MSIQETGFLRSWLRKIMQQTNVSSITAGNRNMDINKKDLQDKCVLLDRDTLPNKTALRNTDIEPWYKQFWPWFVFGLPASVVVAGIAMVYIAFKYADSTVSNDYFRDGLAVKENIDQDKIARVQKLNATLRFDTQVQELLLQLQGEVISEANDLAVESLDKASNIEYQATAMIYFPSHLRLELSHPVDASLDFSIDLIHLAQGQYHGEYEHLYMQRYYLRLLPMPEQQWRLQGEIDFNQLAEDNQLQLVYR